MTIQDYIKAVPQERQAVFSKIWDRIRERLPDGFTQQINYGMPSIVVPHSLYPAGYHCDPKLPLPFISLASQKQSINYYHLGLYADPDLYNWFMEACAKVARHKLDAGKSCFRFKYLDEIPYEAIGELSSRISAEAWIAIYEAERKKPGR